MQNEDVNLTVAKLHAAIGILGNAQNKEWAVANSELVSDATKFLKEQLAPQ